MQDNYSKTPTDEIRQYVMYLWERNIKNKSEWLFHGTSILFLSSIQKYGLDQNAIPKGTKRSIEKISGILNAIHSQKYVIADINLDMSKKPISLTSSKDVIRSAVAYNLPAFLYELLNEEHIRSNPDLDRAIAGLNGEEQRMCKIIWRFGKILRAKNKAVLLLVAFNSDFLKYLGIPDYISDFNLFYSEICQRRISSRLSSNEPVAKIARDMSCICRSPFSALRSLLEENSQYKGVVEYLAPIDEIRVYKSIPPSFIYLEVKGIFGYNVVNISQWRGDLTPRII